jgi:flavin reductase (DIM6/NTAB) family NADH-FMN oxidoreductase RutF
MARRDIAPYDFATRSFAVLAKEWLLLTAGENRPGRFNGMTIAWGLLGTMWKKPVVLVAVRRSRYTYELMEDTETFTVTAFPESYRDTLMRLGRTSGYDGDKMAGCGLTPEPSKTVPTPVYAEATLAIECRKIYSTPLDPARILSEEVSDIYVEGDYHTFYIGEVLHITGTDDYLAGAAPSKTAKKKTTKKKTTKKKAAKKKTARKTTAKTTAAKKATKTAGAKTTTGKKATKKKTGTKGAKATAKKKTTAGKTATAVSKKKTSGGS